MGCAVIRIISKLSQLCIHSAKILFLKCLLCSLSSKPAVVQCKPNKFPTIKELVLKLPFASSKH